MQADVLSQRPGGCSGEEQCGAPFYSPQSHASLGIRGLGAPCEAQTILTWERTMSMAAPEVPPHRKQAIWALLGARPGWDSGAWVASGHNAAGALVG